MTRTALILLSLLFLHSQPSQAGRCQAYRSAYYRLHKVCAKIESRDVCESRAYRGACFWKYRASNCISSNPNIPPEGCARLFYSRSLSYHYHCKCSLE